MNIDDILIIVIVAILIMFVYKGCKCSSGIDPTGKSKIKRTANRVMDNILNNLDDELEDDELEDDELEDEVRENMRSTSNMVEGMAPLNFGTFIDNYPRGECRTGKFWERKSCEVGNCPLGTTVDNPDFCRIQCAQDPDGDERQKCYEVCMKNIEC